MAYKKYITEEETLKLFGCSANSLKCYRVRGQVKYKTDKAGSEYKGTGKRLIRTYDKESVEAWKADLDKRKKIIADRFKAERPARDKAQEEKKLAKKVDRELEKEQKKEYAEFLALLETQNQNKIYYFSEDFYKRKDCISLRPNPKQKILLDAISNRDKYGYKIFVIHGGNRLGKSTIGGIIAISFMLGYWPWDRDQTPICKSPMKIRWVAQDWDKADSTLCEKLDEWWPSIIPVDTSKNNNSVRDKWVNPLNKHKLELMSNNSESKAFESWDGDIIIWDEPPTESNRDACARGLVDRCGIEIYTMTLMTEPWVHRKIIQARNPDGTPDKSVFVVEGEIYDNEGYGLTKEGIEQYAKTIDEDQRMTRIYGIPLYLSGLVLPQFKREMHLVERFKVPLDWIVDITIDVHPKERQAVLFVATNPFGIKYAVYELWLHASGKEIADEIVRVIKQNVFRVGTIAIDPLSKADSNNPGTVYDQIENVLYVHGHTLDTASKAKESGIIKTKEALMGPNKIPSLFFFDDLVRTVFEIEGWMYDKEQIPIKKDDHMMENLYRIMLYDTRWYDMEEEEDMKREQPKERRGVNAITRY